MALNFEKWNKYMDSQKQQKQQLTAFFFLNLFAKLLFGI